jgi:hypothetical protein
MWQTTVLLGMAACGANKSELETGAAAGQPISVDVEVAPDGALTAARVYVSSEAEEDEDGDEAIPLDELPGEVTAAMEANWPGATWLAAEKEGNTWGVEFVTVDGEHLEAEFDADGNVIETERADHDDDAASVARAFVVGTPAADTSVYGVQLESTSALPSGPIRAVGQHTGDRTLRCDVATPAEANVRSVGGISQGIVASGDGFTITLLDLEIAADASTPVTVVEDPLEPEDD